MKKRLSLLVAAMFVVSTMAVAPVFAGDKDNGNGKDKDYVCHATGSEKNPYVLLYVPTNSAHLDESKSGFHTDDIEPTYDDKGKPTCPDKKDDNGKDECDNKDDNGKKDDDDFDNDGKKNHKDDDDDNDKVKDDKDDDDDNDKVKDDKDDDDDNDGIKDCDDNGKK